MVLDINKKPKAQFQTIKSKLHEKLRYPLIHGPQIEALARRASIIRCRITWLLKAFLVLHLPYTGQDHISRHVEVDVNLIRQIGFVVAPPHNINHGHPPSPENQILRAILTNLYNMMMVPSLPPNDVKPDGTDLPDVISYMATEIITNYTSNIIQHFREKKVIFDIIDSNENWTADEKTSEKAVFNSRSEIYVRAIYSCNGTWNDDHTIFTFNEDEDFPEYITDAISQLKNRILPRLQVFKDDSILEHLRAHPWVFFHSIVHMSQYLALHGYKSLSPFPLSVSNIPYFFDLDTTTLVKILWPDNPNSPVGQKVVQVFGQWRNKGQAKDLVGVAHDRIWSVFFKTEIRHFFHGRSNPDPPDDVLPTYLTKHSYTFRHRIATDGVALCVSLIKKELARYKRVKAPKNMEYKIPFIDRLTNEQKVPLTNKQIVAIDPGIVNEIQAVSINSFNYNAAGNIQQRRNVIKERKQFRGTRAQRMRELNIKKNRKKREKEIKIVIGANGTTVEKNETITSNFSKKTCRLDSYFQWLHHMSRRNAATYQYYITKKHRNRRFRAFHSKQKNESRFISNFRTTFGTPDRTFVCIGDWSESHHRRNSDPRKGRGYINLFLRNGYKVYLVHEYRTSKMCSNCQTVGLEMEKFLEVVNPRPFSRRQFPTELCHGLLRCVSNQVGIRRCGLVCNRDVNAAINIWILANAVMSNQVRPNYLTHQVAANN